MVKIKGIFKKDYNSNSEMIMEDDTAASISELMDTAASLLSKPNQHPQEHQQSQQQEQKQQQKPLDPSKIYEFYIHELIPAIMASLPILMNRLAVDTKAWIEEIYQKSIHFLLPGWSEAQRHGWVELWEQTIHNTTQHSSAVADYLLSHFDTNGDGHISTSELINMTELISKLHPAVTTGRESQSFLRWLSREWPLFDWKLGLFVWKSFGGLLFVLTVLSIVPGRLHRVSGKILRWPILLMTYLLIFVELVVYIVIRLFIRIAETFVATPKHRVLRQQMATAESYEDWYEYAAALDISQKREKWQKDTENDSTGYRYNWALIRQLMNDMRQARDSGDSLMAVAVLRQCTRKNVGGIMSEDLFSYTNTGEPKYIVSEFIEEVAKTLHWVTDEALKMKDIQNPAEAEARIKYEKSLDRKVKNEKEKLWGLLVSWATLSFHGDSDAEKMSPKQVFQKNNNQDEIIGRASFDSHETPNTAKVSPNFHRKQLVDFLKGARAAYGRTALCLSGGAMMGLYHLGHLQGLMETDSLPHIISGTSAGSVIAALVCTRTNEELRRDLVPELFAPKMKCFARSWPDRIRSLWKNGHMFSKDEWLEMIRWFTLDLTFQEAYEKTGRIFCITLASTTKKAPPVLINYISAPHVTIASAVIASAAVPGFVAPVQLQIKDPDGTIRSAGDETYFDGSIEHDIPVNGLAEMLNCQFIVAAQCNPHVVPFFFQAAPGRPNRWSSGKQEANWRGGFLLAALEMYLKNDMKAKFVFLNDLEAAVGFTSTMMVQQFHGSTTIVPQVQLRDFATLFSDPTTPQVERCLKVGTVAAYEHAAMIRLHYRIADTIEECLQKLGIGDSSKKAKPSRRASYEINAQIANAVAHIHDPLEVRNDMPAIISAALKERLNESDSSTTVSENSFF